MWIPRYIEPRLIQSAATRPVVVLTGARQTGKTSTLRRLFPGHGFVTLDLPSEAAQAEHDPASFLGRHQPPVIIDEVQYAPGLFRHLKVAVDERRGQPGQYVLTGSQKFMLMKAWPTPSPGAPTSSSSRPCHSARSARRFRPPRWMPRSCAAGFRSFTPRRASTPPPSTSRTSPPISSATSVRWPTSGACATSSGSSGPAPSARRSC